VTYIYIFFFHASKVANWCQAMLMNPCRTRRRLRKGLGDWGNLFDHAVNADFSEEFQVGVIFS
jgi:hypothetical protein